MVSLMQSRQDRAALSIAAMVEELSRVLSIQAFEAGLNPTQWAALRYVASANESARSIGAFARLNRTTPSSASQTVGALVAKGLLSKEPGRDARERLLRLTLKAKAMLRRDPLKDLARIIGGLSPNQQFVLAESLETLMREVMAESSASL